MREMKDSGYSWIGKIPTDWSMGRVKNAFVRKNEKAMKEDPVILSLARSGVRIRDVSNNEGQIAESYFNYNPVLEGDLLLNPMDLYSGANCSISKVSGVISPAYINLKSNNEINSNFYDYYFKIQYWLMAFFSYGKGVSFENRWTLNIETLMNYPVVMMSYKEQCKRANLLDDKCTKIDSIVAKQQMIVEKLLKYKQATITEMVINEKWPIYRLRHCINKIEQGWSSPAAETVDDINGWFVLSLSAIKGGKFNYEARKPIDSDANIPENLQIRGGDFLMTRSNTRELVGDVCVVTECVTKTIFSDLIYRITFDELLVTEYARYLLQSAFVRQQIQESARGSSGTMPKISHKAIKEIKVYLPSVNEQRILLNKLDEKVNKIDLIIKKKQALIDKILAYKKSLIYEVVTGKREV